MDFGDVAVRENFGMIYIMDKKLSGPNFAILGPNSRVKKNSVCGLEIITLGRKIIVLGLFSTKKKQFT